MSYNDLSSQIGWTSAILLVAITLLLFLFKRRKFTCMINKLPGPKCHPILGFAYNMLGLSFEERINLAMDTYKKYYNDGLLHFWMGPLPVVTVMKPEYVEVILSSQVHLDKSFMYTFTHSWLGLGLLNSSGAKWHSRRKLLTPAFHFGILEEFLPIFNEKSKILVEKIDANENDNSNLYQLITLCSLDIICATAMGCDVCAQLNQDSKYVSAVSEATRQIFDRINSPLYYSNFIYTLSYPGRRYRKNVDILKSFTRKVIQDKREEFRQRKARNLNKNAQNEENEFGGKRKRNFLDILFEYSDKGQALSNDDIQEEVDTFMFEGHDTTSSGIYWALFHLGLHPHIQKKLHQDLDSIFGDSDRNVQLEDLSKLKYLDMVCKESLRMTPAVPMIGRTSKEDLKLGEHLIPAGVTCCLLPIITHRLEDHFPDPFKFDPDRFLPENCKGRHPYAFIPFSAGSRNCIGQKFAVMEEKVVLSNILRKFEVRTDSIPEFPEGAYYRPELTTVPSPKCKIHIRRRQF